jgi:hypothetical protein
MFYAYWASFNIPLMWNVDFWKAPSPRGSFERGDGQRQWGKKCIIFTLLLTALSSIPLHSTYLWLSIQRYAHKNCLNLRALAWHTRLRIKIRRTSVCNSRCTRQKIALCSATYLYLAQLSRRSHVSHLNIQRFINYTFYWKLCQNKHRVTFLSVHWVKLF